MSHSPSPRHPGGANADALHGESLFCYGTLRHPLILKAVAGRQFTGSDAVLDDYACYCLENVAFPGVVAETGAHSEGTLYEGLSALHLQRLDQYEGDWYERQRVQIRVGEARVAAWAYVLSPLGARHLTAKAWSYSYFVRHHLPGYLGQL